MEELIAASPRIIIHDFQNPQKEGGNIRAPRYRKLEREKSMKKEEKIRLDNKKSFWTLSFNRLIDLFTLSVTDLRLAYERDRNLLTEKTLRRR